MASPKARPANLRLLTGRGNGTDSGGRKVEPGPKFRHIPPEPPEWLEGEARAEWDRVLPELERLNLVKSPDRASLVAYCETWARFCEARAMCVEQGIIAKNSQGLVRAPWFVAQLSASKELRAFATEFGLTPAAESKLAADTGDDSDENPFG